jgi:hypothetical protein
VVKNWRDVIYERLFGTLYQLSWSECGLNHRLSWNTECAMDRDLYKLVSCGKFVNDILFSTIYKTHYLTYLTLGHHVLAVILCSYLNFFELSTA